MKKIFFLFFLFICLRCDSPKKTPQKIARKSTPEEILKKLEDIERWGYQKEAEALYCKFTSSSEVEKLRFDFFERWATILERLEQHERRANVLETMLRLFPKHSKNVRRKLYEYYIYKWEWEKAGKMAEEILSKDNPPDFLQLKKDIKFFRIWTHRKLIWEEKFHKYPDWSMAFLDQEITIENTLRIQSLSKSSQHGGRLFLWNGGSFQLYFDLKIEHIPFADSIKVGIFSENFEKKIMAQFGLSGGQGGYNYHAHLNCTSLSKMQTLKYYPYEKNIWYRVQIEYIREMKKVRLQIWRLKNTRTKLRKQIIYTLAKVERYFPKGKYFIGVLPGAGRRSNVSLINVDDFSLYGSRNIWIRAKPDILNRMTALYKINRMANHDWTGALGSYRILLAQNPSFSEAVEFKIYLLNKKIGKTYAREMIRSLKILLTKKEDRPSREFFLQLFRIYILRMSSSSRYSYSERKFLKSVYQDEKLLMAAISFIKYRAYVIRVLEKVLLWLK